jgi:hypothetical protein
MSAHLSSVNKLRTLSKSRTKKSLIPLATGSTSRSHKRVYSDISSLARLRTMKLMTTAKAKPICNPTVETVREVPKTRLINGNLQFRSWKLQSLMFSTASPIANIEKNFNRGLLVESNVNEDDTLVLLLENIEENID